MKLLSLILIILSTSISAKELRKIDLRKRTLDNKIIESCQGYDGSIPGSCFYIENPIIQANFGEAYYTTNNIDQTPSDTYLTIVISSYETGLCGFEPYDDIGMAVKHFVCDSSYCKRDNSTLKFSSQWIVTTAKRIYLNTTISVAGGAWQLKTSALHYDNTLSRIQVGTSYGWIGLGTGSGANKNFQGENPTFSILLNETNDYSGSLVFGFDPMIANIDNLLMVIGSDENWKMQLISLSFGSVVYSDPENTLPLFFDLLIDGIIFPTKLIDSLVDEMKDHNLDCYWYGCRTKTGDSIDSLPLLVFGLADGSNFSLRPTDYMKATESHYDGSYYRSLGFRRNEGLHQYYEDHIVLGWDVLANFYTLFQQIDGVNTISFYDVNSAKAEIQITPTDFQDSQDLTLILIISGVILIVIFIVCVGVLLFKPKKGNNIETRTTELSKLEASNASDASVDPTADLQEGNHLL